MVHSGDLDAEKRRVLSSKTFTLKIMITKLPRTFVLVYCFNAYFYNI